MKDTESATDFAMVSKSLVRESHLEIIRESATERDQCPKAIWIEERKWMWGSEKADLSKFKKLKEVS